LICKPPRQCALSLSKRLVLPSEQAHGASLWLTRVTDPAVLA
jgi:hypothetical protein